MTLVFLALAGDLNVYESFPSYRIAAMALLIVMEVEKDDP
jgi:hypothetical protein